MSIIKSNPLVHIRSEPEMAETLLRDVRNGLDGDYIRTQSRGSCASGKMSFTLSFSMRCSVQV